MSAKRTFSTPRLAFQQKVNCLLVFLQYKTTKSLNIFIFPACASGKVRSCDKETIIKKVKVLLGSLAMISVLSMSGCALFDPFWWADGPHHGGGGGHYDGGGDRGDRGGDRGGW